MQFSATLAAAEGASCAIAAYLPLDRHSISALCFPPQQDCPDGEIDALGEIVEAPIFLSLNAGWPKSSRSAQ